MAEAQIGYWKMKYEMLVDRPIRYISEVIGHLASAALNSAHPDYHSGHSQTSGAFVAVLSSLFGTNYKLTVRTYDNPGVAPRPYNSFNEMCDDIGKSRVYRGIHYTYSCVEGAKQGGKIGENILNTLKFKK